jgi:hypothetical protein
METCCKNATAATCLLAAAQSKASAPRTSRRPTTARAAQPLPPAAGPSLAALVTITVPLATWQGRSETPGQADGFGLLDGDDARALAAAAARHPRTRWCVTAVNPDGTAAAHGCLPGRHPPPGPVGLNATMTRWPAVPAITPAPRPAITPAGS